MARSTRKKRSLWVTHEIERTRGEGAQRGNISAGKAIAAAVRTTLGPKGMDKMLVGSDGTVVVTNDGSSVLDRLDVADPMAKTLVDVAAAQDSAIGDGTTTVVLLAGELLAAAESLLERGLHPTTIVQGYREAAEYARQRLEEHRITIDPTDEILRDVARSVVTGKWNDIATDRFADLVISAVRAVASDDRIDLQRLGIKAYPGGELSESELVDGILVDMNTSSTTIESSNRKLPQTLTDVNVALIDQEMTVGNAATIDTATVTDTSQLERLRSYEENVRTNIVCTITDLNVDVVFCQKSIDDAVRNALAREGVLSIERTRQDEFDSIARAAGATAVPSVGLLDPADVGQVGAVERRNVGGTEALAITNCSSEKQTSLLLRGGTEHVADETRRIVKDCLSVVQLAVQEKTVVPGGGAIELALARDLSSHAQHVGGRQQLAISAFSEALEGVPRTLAANAGVNPIDTVVELKSRHSAGDDSVGIGTDGDCKDMVAAGVVEPCSVVDCYLTNALESVAMTLRIDDVFTIRKSGDVPDSHDHRQKDHYSDESVRASTGYPWAIGH